MSAEEAFSWLVDRVKNGKEVTLDIINEIVESRSVVDPIASSDAVTIFYSGGEDSVANMLADTNNPAIRLIRRTEAFDFLTQNQEGYSIESIVRYAIAHSDPTMSTTEVTGAMIEALYGVSEEGSGVEEVGKGLWSQISSRFAAETTGDSYSLCSNARSDRIFARDELKQLLNAVDDNSKIGGFTNTIHNLTTSKIMPFIMMM